MLEIQWRDTHEILNLRCDPGSPGLRERVETAMGMELPVAACSTAASAAVRILWAGPDDWFVIGLDQRPQALLDRLREHLAGMHHAVTDVSSGYAVLRLAGTAAHDILAQGCPIDLHPRAFRPGTAVGSQFFKISVWLWRPDAEPVYEMLVRTSFAGYVTTMLAKACEISGRRLVDRSSGTSGPDARREAGKRVDGHPAQEEPASMPA